MVSEKEDSYWARIISIENKRKIEKEKKTKKILTELTKAFVIIGGFLVISIFSSYAGYGALHYMQGLEQMSSPEILFSAFGIAAITAMFMTWMFSIIYQDIVKETKED